jgi:hypothetical protein
MAVSYDPKVLADFFGTPGEIGPLGDTEDAILCLEYQGPLLKYNFHLLLADEVALVMANNIRHLGECLYEVNVPCSAITAGENRLKFHYGPPASRESLQMILVKRDDGELMVWPVGHYPPGHAHYLSPDQGKNNQ